MNIFTDINWAGAYDQFKIIFTSLLIVALYIALAYAGILYILANKIRYGFGVVPKKTMRNYTLTKSSTLSVLGNAERWQRVADESDEKHDSFLLYYLDRTQTEGFIIGRLYPTPNSKGVYVYVHGLGDDLTRGLEYLEVARTYGYDLLVYDQPNHGKSWNNGRGNCYGYNNCRALVEVMRYVHQRFPEKKTIIHGASMGGATVTFAMADNENKKKNWYANVEKVFLENPMLDLKRLLFSLVLDMGAHFIKTNHILVMYGWLTKANPYYTALSVVGGINKQVYLFHSTEDTIIPFYLALQAKAQNSRIKLTIYEHGEHSMLFQQDPKPFLAALDPV